MRVISRVRRRRAVALGAAGVCIAILLSIASAADAVGRPAQTAAPSSSTTAPGPPELLGGVTVTGAVVHTPGRPDRKLTGNQATAFMQAWFPDSVFGKLSNVPRPTGVPISRLVATTRWQGQDIPITVYYANKGGEIFVGMPAQSFGWALVQSEKWIDPPQQARVTQAFEGKLTPVTSPTAPPTTPPTAATTKKSSGSSSSPLPWILLGIGVVIVAGAGAFFVTRGRKSTPSTSSS
jgi:hypothetical protein